jgi:serine/threonine protein kinase/tetratricopeptide (TPR) repeat protein
LAPVVVPIVPDYDLLRRIAGGAYGEVWLARSQATGAFRAAKIVWRHTFEDDRPFQREFEGIQRFERISREHPSQLALFHIGHNEAEGYFYYVMELADSVPAENDTRQLTTKEPKIRNEKSEIRPELFDVEGYTAHTLRADLEKGRLPAAKVLEIGLALSEALLHLHSHGLVHRDVKPSNVIFVNGRPKLADIGLVTDASDQCSIVGTEGYLPPEGPGAPQADIFALGKVLYEAATGMDRREFPKLPDDLRSWPDANEVFELNEIILKASARDVRQRYQSCEEMHADLALLGEGKSVKQKRTQQQRWVVCKKAGIGVTTLAALAAAFVFLSRGNMPADPFPDGPNSTNLIANADCEKGLAIIREDNNAQLTEAYSYFTNAIKLDTNFARPYVGLLEMALRDSGTVLTSLEAVKIRHEAADHLKKLAPDLGATFVAQSINSFYRWDFYTAEQFALQAIKANPKYELGHTWYGYMLALWGRPKESREQLQLLFNLRLASSKAIIYECMGDSYYAQRDFTNAITWYQKGVDLYGHHRENLYWLARAQWAIGDCQNSMDTFQRRDLLNVTNELEISQIKQKYAGFHQAFHDGGLPGYWEHLRKRSETNTNASFVWKATIQINLGQTSEAMESLEQAFANQEGWGQDNGLGLNTLLFDEHWDSLHNDPRFKQLLNELGFTRVMRPQTR